MAAIDILAANDGIAPQPAYEPHDSYRVSMVEPSMDTKYNYAVTVKENTSTAPVFVTPSKETPGLYITGLGSQYPPFLFPPEKLEGFIKRWYDLETPG